MLFKLTPVSDDITVQLAPQLFSPNENTQA
jgi:hypothetical protein